jgi:RNase P subunit RPR2
MSDDSVSLASYLTTSELDTLKGRLNSSKIKYVVNGHGAKSRYQSAYYEIRVAKEDYPQAKIIANKFKAANFIKSRSCPKCSSTVYEEVTDLSFFQKILHIGTTPVKCKKCKTQFFI